MLMAMAVREVIIRVDETIQNMSVFPDRFFFP